MARVTVLLSGQLVARHQQALLELHKIGRGLAQRAFLHMLAQSAWQIRTTRHMIEVLRLHLLLVRFTVIEVIEIGNYNRHRQSDG